MITDMDHPNYQEEIDASAYELFEQDWSRRVVEEICYELGTFGYEIVEQGEEGDDYRGRIIFATDHHAVQLLPNKRFAVHWTFYLNKPLQCEEFASIRYLLDETEDMPRLVGKVRSLLLVS